MEIVICATADEVARAGGGKVVEVVSGVAEPVLGVATGSSPLSLYADLARRIGEGTLDLSHARAFSLDEYVGMPASDPRSYAWTIRTTVTEPLGLDPARVTTPDGMADDIDAACAAYESAIADAGGVDVQILGIGSNGHIGFNEPTSSFASRTRLKTLAEATRDDNRRFFTDGEEVPTLCLTQGLGTIMDARHVVLVALGEQKADAIARAVEGPVSAMCPASVLQFHRHATLILDEAAASRLQLADYYRFVYANKPGAPYA